MINVEELNIIIDKMKGYKPIKVIKVTTDFYNRLELQPSWSPAKPLPHFCLASYQGIPVVINDDVKNHYELVY